MPRPFSNARSSPSDPMEHPKASDPEDSVNTPSHRSANSKKKFLRKGNEGLGEIDSPLAGCFL